MYLVAASHLTDLALVRDTRPALWRELRRFNAPIQLAVAAAHDVLPHVKTPSELAIISLAPCHSGSPELHRWVRDIEAGGAVKMNPTHTLHAVDNLALSVLSLSLGTRGWSMSLGGAAGMFWSALELALEREEREVLIVGGDQASGSHESDFAPSRAAGFAMLLTRERAPCAATGHAMRLVGVEIRSDVFSARLAQICPNTGQDEAETREHDGSACEHDGRAMTLMSVRPNIGQTGGEQRGREIERMTRMSRCLDAARGAITMLAALHGAGCGEWTYEVPAEDGDGIDDIVVHWEVGA